MQESIWQDNVEFKHLRSNEQNFEGASGLGDGFSLGEIVLQRCLISLQPKQTTTHTLLYQQFPYIRHFVHSSCAQNRTSNYRKFQTKVDGKPTGVRYSNPCAEPSTVVHVLHETSKNVEHPRSWFRIRAYPRLLR